MSHPGALAHIERLDHAVYTSIDTGTRVDEINLPKSDVRYELK